MTIPDNGGSVTTAPNPPEWADYVERGRKHRQANDDANWGLGDDVVEMCDTLGFDPKPGRPPANENVRTLSEYAAEVDISSRRVSECYANSRFYGNLRTSGDYATWAHHDLARRNSDNDLDNALELLSTAKALRMHYRAFKRYLEGILFEGLVDVQDLPASLQAYAVGRKQVWVEISEPRE